MVTAMVLVRVTPATVSMPRASNWDWEAPAVALALGANAVCIGRPYLWALGAFGEPGVARCLEILRAEFALAMRQAGATSIANINGSFVGRL